MNSNTVHSSQKFQKQAVLLVEDSDSLRALMSFILGKTYRVFPARNGLEAMAWLQNGLLPDVIVTDVQMPELDGAALIANLRCSGIYKHIPVVVVSGSCVPAELDQIRLLGAQDVLPKPFKPAELHGSIARLMQPFAAAA